MAIVSFERLSITKKILFPIISMLVVSTILLMITFHN